MEKIAASLTPRRCLVLAPAIACLLFYGACSSTSSNSLGPATMAQLVEGRSVGGVPLAEDAGKYLWVERLAEMKSNGLIADYERQTPVRPVNDEELFRLVGVRGGDFPVVEYYVNRDTAGVTVTQKLFDGFATDSQVASARLTRENSAVTLRTLRQ